MPLDFLPIDGISPEWFDQLFRKHTLRTTARGKDGVRPKQYAKNLEQEINLIIARLNAGNYKFTRYREILLSRGYDRLPRQISVPTVRDRLVLRATLEHLKHAFQALLPSPPHRFVKDVRDEIAKSRDNSSFIRMDIRDFFPSIQHDRLMVAVNASALDPRFKTVIETALKTPTGGSLTIPTVGVPQGLTISNLLAAIYLKEFDDEMQSEGFYRRYVDDILMIATSEKANERYVSATNSLSKIGLKTHPLGKVGKTEIKRLADGVEYLGYTLSSESVSVRESSLAKMFTNLAKVLTSIKRGHDLERHFYRLNLKITGCLVDNTRRGWLMFFSQTENISQLAFLDAWLKRELADIPPKNQRAMKSFKRAYYEVRYSLGKTTYIPNYDEYDIVQKAEVVRILSKRSEAQIATMDVELIDAEFHRLIGKEISELERDLMKAFS